MPKLLPKLQTAIYVLNKADALRTQLLRRIDRNDGWNVVVNQREDGNWVAEAMNDRLGKAYAGEPESAALRAIASLKFVLESHSIRLAL